MLEDRVLVWKLRHDSSDSLRHIYEKYKHDMLAIASALMRDPSDAEDVVQDVFVAFADGARQFELSGTLKGYLVTCVVNLARDRLRAKNRPIRPDKVLTGSISDRPDKAVMNREERELLLEALGQLPLPQREAIVMRLRGGMRFKQIARSQGVSINTAQSRYRCAIEKLRTILNHEVKK